MALVIHSGPCSGGQRHGALTRLNTAFIISVDEELTMLSERHVTGRWWKIILSAGLWLVSMAGILASIYWLRQIFLALTMYFGGKVLEAEAVAPLVVAGLGLAATVVIIGTTEYHRRHFLQTGSWRLHAVLIGIVAAIGIAHSVFVGF